MLSLDLAHEIVPSQSKFKVLTTKVCIDFMHCRLAVIRLDWGQVILHQCSVIYHSVLFVLSSCLVQCRDVQCCAVTVLCCIFFPAMTCHAVPYRTITVQCSAWLGRVGLYVYVASTANCICLHNCLCLHNSRSSCS